MQLDEKMVDNNRGEFLFTKSFCSISRGATIVTGFRKIDAVQEDITGYVRWVQDHT